MTTFHHYKDIEEKLRQAAGLMPQPTKPLPLSPVMEKRCRSDRNRFSLWSMPVWRTAVTVLLIFAVGSTTALAASPKLRIAIAQFFSSGVTEEIPMDELEPEKSVPDADTSKTASSASGELSQNITRQTSGSLTLVQNVTLDSHFTASYASSPDYLALEETPSGTPIFRVRTEDGKTVYYSVTDGKLKEIAPTAHTLTATAQLGTLPGIMASHGENDKYRNLTLPPMEFTVNWKQYGLDILIDYSETGDHFDIGSAYGADLETYYDGSFFYRVLAGQADMIEVFFCLDEQETFYQYPFLLNLVTGEVSDPLALADLSDWPCITDLSIQDDLATATAMAGSSHGDLQKITIDLGTGIVTSESASAQKPPADDCFTWFTVGEDTLFYVTGSEESGNGYLYNTKTGESTVLFEDTTYYALWGGITQTDSYWQSIGYGYLVYYADDMVFLIDLNDGGAMTVLKDIPMHNNIDFFMNYEATVLSISSYSEEPFHTTRLCLLDLKTMKAWYFDRDLPEGVEEKEYYWNGEYGYVISAENTETGTNYIYLYQYTP